MIPAPAKLKSVSPRRGRPPQVGLRQKILVVAEQVFTRLPYHEVLMEEVARASGVGKGTVYCYFPSKRELYLALVFEGIERLNQNLRVEISVPDVAARKIERIVHCILAYFWHRRLFFALIHQNEHTADDPAAREWLRRRVAISRLIQRAIEEGVASGDFRPIEPRIAAEMLLGMIRAVNRYRTAQDAIDDLVAAVVAMFVDGMRMNRRGARARGNSKRRR